MERPPPRPMRRVGSGRFPVKVSTGNAEFIPDPSSPASHHSRPPPVPSRSHSRAPSQHNAASTNRRPAVTPLLINNERLRSNSEGILQATRAKRMGIVSRKASDLGTVVEARANQNRFSHYRGLSHGSSMHGNGVTTGLSSSDESSTSPNSPPDLERTRGTYVRRLSSLPEHKRVSNSPDNLVEGAKGLLYSLYLVQPHISKLIGLAREDGTKPSSLERVFYNASTHVVELDREIHQLDLLSTEEFDTQLRSNERVRMACRDCVRAYQQVATLLLGNVRKMVGLGDARYVRTLLLLVFGGLAEVRNACASLSLKREGRKARRQAPRGRSLRDHSLTPTQEHPNPGQSLRTLNAGQPNRRREPSARIQPPAPLRINGNARAGSVSAAVEPTPMSSDSFGIPDTPYGTSRSNTLQTVEDLEEERQFEKIFLKLKRASDIVLKTLPSLKYQFTRSIEASKRPDTRTELRQLWTTLEQRCSFAMQMAEALRQALSTVKFKEPETRSQRDFWELCNTFVKAFVEVALLIRDAKKLDLIPNDVLQLLRPMQQAVKDIGVLIENSPWKDLAVPQPATVSHTPSVGHGGTHGAFYSLSSSALPTPALTASASQTSPYVTPLPATPLSAALGPAAQATVPLSSGGYRNGTIFNGNVLDGSDAGLSLSSRSMTATTVEYPGYGPALYTPQGSRSQSRHPESRHPY
ncbi:MAG: hypothetical protein M1817_004024 [Caeruleum heppii]|nr:MAG: hypothetical protein M1817_004024 [Caeruleum heppii]